MQSTIALTLARRLSARSALLTDLVLILLGSLLVALFAQISLPLPFTPVPLTGQTFAVLVVGAALGARRGAASLALYVFEGAIGLPVYAGASSGIATLLGPTGGYLLGFVAAAFVVGGLAERGLERRWTTARVPFLAGSLVIYLFGVLWLSYFLGLEAAIENGLVPFLAGDAIKLILAAVMLPSARAMVRQFER